MDGLTEQIEAFMAGAAWTLDDDTDPRQAMPAETLADKALREMPWRLQLTERRHKTSLPARER